MATAFYWKLCGLDNFTLRSKSNKDKIYGVTRMSQKVSLEKSRSTNIVEPNFSLGSNALIALSPDQDPGVKFLHTFSTTKLSSTVQ